jgi:dTDP-4-dehydrorhamnose 3,5-epimerase
MHFQVFPHPEAKLVRCIAGSIVDIIVDLRPGSPTGFEHIAVELSAENRRALACPYFAHGYQTLVDGAEVLYQVSGSYAPAAGAACAGAVGLGLDWPLRHSLSVRRTPAGRLLADRDHRLLDGMPEPAGASR